MLALRGVGDPRCTAVEDVVVLGADVGCPLRYVGLLLGVWVVTAIDSTEYPRFKRVVPARELAEAFTPTVADAPVQRGWPASPRP
jgi:hypothetical protein